MAIDASTLTRLDPARRPTAWLIGSGLAATALYAGTLAREFWLPGAFPAAYGDIPISLGQNYGGFLEWTAIMAAAFALWALALRAVSALPSGRRTLAIILGIAAMHFASLLLTYPATSADVFHYTAQARVLWQHGANPLVTPPSAFDFPDIEPNLYWWWRPSLSARNRSVLPRAECSLSE